MTASIIQRLVRLARAVFPGVSLFPRARIFSSERLVRLALAVSGGICLTLAFPNWELAGLGWVGPGLLLASGIGCTGRAAFGFGFVGGLAFYLTSLCWLLRIPFPIGALAGWLALAVYCALYPAFWVWLSTWMASRQVRDGPECRASPADWAPLSRLESSSIPVPEVPTSAPSSHLWGLTLLGRLPWPGRTVWCLTCSGLWVALEMLRGRFLTGFPWNFLGSSQFRILPVTQIAAWTGVYGVTFLMVWFAVSLICAVSVFLKDPARHRSWMSEIMLPILAISVITALGFGRIASALREVPGKAPDSNLRLALLQPAIPQTMIFDPSEWQSRFQKLLAMSESAAARHPDAIVWPEGAMPPWTEENFRAMTNLASVHRVWMIFGADDFERTADKTNYYNSAVLFGPDGKFVTSYRKRRLVIFGEYIPLIRWLPVIRHLTPIQDGFASGDRPGDFQLGNAALQARLGVFICFEDAFPDPTREFVRPDTDALLNLTNDGWFGESAAQWQQAAMSVFRAIENGVPLVRCTNNGLTCWIDQFGRIRQFLDVDGSIYQAGVMVADIPLLSNRPRLPTYYYRHGDQFGWVCFALAGLQIVKRSFPAWLGLHRSRRARPSMDISAP